MGNLNFCPAWLDHSFSPSVEYDTKTIAANWRQPIKWNREAEKNGQRAKVFCTCLHDDVRKGEYARLSTAIAATPHLDWLLLTGDRENLGPSPWQPMPKNVWRGVALHGDDAQELLSALKEYKAAVKFVWTSGAVPGAGDLDLSGIDWLLIDGQSGKSEAQLLELDWASALIDAAKKAGTQIWVIERAESNYWEICLKLQHDLKERRQADRLPFHTPWPAALPTSIPAPIPAPAAPPSEKATDGGKLYIPFIKLLKNGRWRVRVPIPGEATYVRTCDSLEEAERYRDAAFASIPPLINDSIFETLAAKYTTPKGRDWAPEVEKFLSAKGPIPTPDPPPRVEAVDSLPAALPAPDPAPPPPPTPPREEPTPPTILELTSNVTAKTEQEQDDAQDRILLGPDENAMTKQEMLDLHEGYGFDSGKFYIDEEGILFYVRQRYSKDGAECFSDETYLCRGNLRVTGEIKRTDGAGHHFSREVEFKNRWGESTKVKIADNLTASAVLRILAANGLDTTSVERDRPRIAEFLKGWKVRRHVIAVNRRWYNGCCYVTGKGAIGPAPAGKELVLADTFHDEQTYCGTLEGWQKTIGAASVGNRILIDCLSVAFSAFVLEPLNAECMGYMLYCPSSMGKGSTVAAACSVAGTKLSDCIDTPYNIETHATRNSDTLIVFDELDATKNLAEFSRNIYILGNGRGKGRFTKEKSTWRVPWMVTGETSMSKVRADAKMKPLTRGETVRLIEIFADAGKGLGTFDCIHDHQGAREFADALQAWSVQNQGVAAEAFLIRVTADLPYAIKKLNETRESFIADEKTKLGLTNPPPDLIRAMDHFAVAAASGELATEFGTVPWQPGDARRALSETFGLWYATDYNPNENVHHGVKQALEWTAANMHRFQKRVGRGGRPEIDVPAEVFRQEACAGFDSLPVAKQLKAEGMLVHNKGRLTLLRRKPNEKGYDLYYCVRLEAANSDNTANKPLASKAVN